MRIIRGNHDHNDDEHNHDNDPAKAPRPASASDADRWAEALVDETEAFLAGLAEDNPHEPNPEPKPVARLVKSLSSEPAAAAVPVEDENLIPALRPQPVQETVPVGRRVPRWARTALPGSAVVVALAVVTTHGQPAVVAVPIDIYAGAWVGFLFWNAAHRPPIRDVAAVVLSAAASVIAAVISLFALGVRALVTGISHRRGDFEATRTAH